MSARRDLTVLKQDNLPPGQQISKELLAANARAISYPANASVYRQGEAADTVHYILQGQVQISITSKQGKQGVIALPLGAGDFLGEISLSKQHLYLSSATTVIPSEIIKISGDAMAILVKADGPVAMAFTAFLLQHSLDIQAELVDHLFNSSEKRLARTLLLLANFGHEGRLEPIANMTQDLLAQRVGTTRGRISFFMNKFRRLGLIDYNGTIHVRSGLLSVVLSDSRLADDT